MIVVTDMKLLVNILFVCFITISPPLQAENIQQLYETEVAINNKPQKNDKVLAVQQALKIVLSRILVGHHILQNEDIQTVLSNAEHYVTETQYSLTETVTNHHRLMRVLFNEQLLIDTLRSLNLGIWNEIRPKTLLWLVIDSPKKAPQLFDANTMYTLNEALLDASTEKKLPILFPIQDLNEHQQLSVNDVLSASSDHLLSTSSRYNMVSILAGKITQKNDCWVAEWTFHFDGKIKQWSDTCQPLKGIALAGLRGVYDVLSRYYAATPESTEINTMIIKINHLKNKTKKMYLINYLESLPIVKTATWIGISQGYDKYRVFFQGSQADLENLFLNGSTLKRKPFIPVGKNEVFYQLFSK